MGIVADPVASWPARAMWTDVTAQSFQPVAVHDSPQLQRAEAMPCDPSPAEIMSTEERIERRAVTCGDADLIPEAR